MSKVYLLVGIIASGKSTWARQQVDLDTFIVCKDNLREMIYGKYSYKEVDEKLIDRLAKECIKELLRSDKNVIIDECWDTINNQTRDTLTQWIKFNFPDTMIYIIYFSSIKENVERRLKNNHGNISKETWYMVKDKMLAKFEPPYLYDDKIDIGERNE